MFVVGVAVVVVAVVLCCMWIVVDYGCGCCCFCRVVGCFVVSWDNFCRLRFVVVLRHECLWCGIRNGVLVSGGNCGRRGWVRRFRCSAGTRGWT